LTKAEPMTATAGPAPAAETDPLLATYAQPPLNIVRGEGVHVFDDRGRAYLDFIGGIAVAATGHCHPRVVEAVQRQAATLLHISNLFGIPNQRELARRLTAKVGPGYRAFFCNSGAEANEAAIKLARRWGSKAGRGSGTIVCAEGSFHGRTLATLAATGQPKYHKGFEPIPAGFKHVPFGDLEALAGALTPDVCAVMLEPIQGEGGVRVPPPGTLRAVRELCDERNVLLIADEVQTGMGRTGRFLACQHEGVRPDIVTLAKALGSGVPIGACIASATAAQGFEPGTHGSTFGGNPLSCAAALATLDVIEDEHLVENALSVGTHLKERLESRFAGSPGTVKEVRGAGLLLGVEFERPVAKDLVRALLAKGVLSNATSERVLRLAPPLTLTVAQADAFVDALEAAVKELAPAVTPGTC
jgi:predicted acetylornithine/succinylornithine family transaminase